MRNIKITHDVDSNVLYVKVVDSKIQDSCSLVDDDFIIVNYNSNEEVVGLQILLISDISSSIWNSYYSSENDKIPSDIFNAVDEWLKERDIE